LTRGKGPKRSLCRVKRGDGNGGACIVLNLAVLYVQDTQMSRTVPRSTPHEIAARARQRIQAIREAIAQIDYLCSGTLLARMNTCGKPNCHCATDPAGRHGPYYQWGHMKAGKLVSRLVSPEQAKLLKGATANYRKLKKLIRAWEAETERIIDAEFTRKP
jgi:Family of unknown function (DUF6788)